MLERLNRDFSLGSDCPNSSSTRTGIVKKQQRHYKPLTNQKRTHIHTKDLPSYPLFMTDRESLAPAHVHGETGLVIERAWTQKRTCQIDIGHEYHQRIKIHYSEPPDNFPPHTSRLLYPQPCHSALFNEKDSYGKGITIGRSSSSLFVLSRSIYLERRKRWRSGLGCTVLCRKMLHLKMRRLAWKKGHFPVRSLCYDFVFWSEHIGLRTRQNI